MNGETRANQRSRRWIPRRTIGDEPEAREGRPFLIIVTIVLIGIYVAALLGNPDLRASLPLLLLTGLMAAQLALYWLLYRLPDESRWLIAYIGVQCLLAFVLSMLMGNPSMTFGLYAPLIGLTVGAFSDRRVAAAVVAVLLGQVVLVMVLLQGWTAITGWLVLVIPMTAFVIIYVELYNRQATAKAEAQALLKDLEAAHRQLSEYAGQVEELTLAAERQRMARELHDTLAQGLAGLILQLEAVKSNLELDRVGRSQEIVEQALVRARSTLADARRAIGDLRDTSGSPDDLGEAIRLEVERFSGATGIPSAVDISLPNRLPGQVSEHAWRVMAEALNNVARHAQAEHVWVSAVAEPTWVDIEVRDDGVGFAPTDPTDRAGHYGLLGMRERARLAGGTVEVTSSSGAGTTVRLRLPLETR